MDVVFNRRVDNDVLKAYAIMGCLGEIANGLADHPIFSCGSENSVRILEKLVNRELEALDYSVDADIRLSSRGRQSEAIQQQIKLAIEQGQKAGREILELWVS